MKFYGALLSVLLASAFASAKPPVVPGVLKANRLCDFMTVEIGFQDGKEVMWAPGFAPESVFIDELKPLQKNTMRLIVSVKVPGVYRVILWQVGDKDYAVLVIDASDLAPTPPPTAPPPTVPPGKKADPLAATGRIRFGSAGCTATIIGPRRADGRWDVLTASHCVGGVNTRGTITLKDGRVLGIKTVGFYATPDLAWCVTDDVIEDLPYAMIAVKNPEKGTAIWHQGYGVDKPGNLEEGTVDASADSNGQLEMTLSVSSGDSGSGIFRKDTGELVAVVCCTSGRGSRTRMWGGCAEAAQTTRRTFSQAITTESVIVHPIGWAKENN